MFLPLSRRDGSKFLKPTSVHFNNTDMIIHYLSSFFFLFLHVVGSFPSKLFIITFNKETILIANLKEQDRIWLMSVSGCGGGQLFL